MLSVASVGDVAVVRVSGRLTIGEGVDELRSTVEMLAADEPRHVVIDLDEATWLDSAALGEIVACRRLVQEAGRRFALAGARGRVQDLIELTRLDRLVDLHPDREDAVRAVSGDTC
ncbi:MAG: anti-sigma factor antagonist [Acidobacteria bacterium]|nr:MAG: anti-sigma factor antagonist [Acidobacteriota bacterium]